MRALWLTCVFIAGCFTPGGTLQLTASGEVLALGGYSFPPASADDPHFVDGWEVKFTRVLTTLDKITLAEKPDSAPTDQSLVGKTVAELDGPWAIDLHAGGPLAGKGGSDEQALAVATLATQNKNGGGPFDATLRYAFGFDLVPASPAGAGKLNVAADDADYAEMVARGWVVLYVGTATWNGGACASTNPAFDFTRLPTTVDFRLGFSTPTSYVNCQNPDNDPAAGLGDEDHQRGVQLRPSTTVVAQMTVHTDHPFWESITHDSPPHFDPLAALAKSGRVTLDDAVGVDYQQLELGGDPLPWRSCDGSYVPANSSAQMGFDSKSVTYNPLGDPAEVLRDYADYLAYNQSTQGHLNSDGLCFVQRHYPSPP